LRDCSVDRKRAEVAIEGVNSLELAVDPRVLSAPSLVLGAVRLQTYQRASEQIQSRP
jgi:hypothetical protein